MPRGSPTTFRENVMALSTYDWMKSHKISQPRIQAAAALKLISWRKIGVLHAEFVKTGEVPQPKLRKPWNKGKMTSNPLSVTDIEELKDHITQQQLNGEIVTAPSLQPWITTKFGKTLTLRK